MKLTGATQAITYGLQGNGTTATDPAGLPGNVGQALSQFVQGAATPHLPKAAADFAFAHAELEKFGRPAAAANLTPHQATLFSDAYRSGAEYASAHPRKAGPDQYFKNTNPPGEHDSRSLPMIESDSERKAQFEKMAPKDQQRVLYEADFYWAGADSVAG